MKTITYAQKNKDKKRQINRKTKQKETWKNIYKLSMTDNYVTNKYNAGIMIIIEKEKRVK